MSGGHDVWMQWRTDHWALTCLVCSWHKVTMDDALARLMAETHHEFS